MIIRKQKRRQEDTESLKPVPRSQCEDCRFEFILPDPPLQHEIYLAMGQFELAMTSIAHWCYKFTKDPPTLSDSQLQGHLEILGVAKDRLPSHKLLELLPLRIETFVYHVLSTTLVSAIAINENASRTILDAQLVALYESMPPCPHDIDAPEWNRITARCREFLAYLFRAHEPEGKKLNQKGVDQLMRQLTDLLVSVLGPAAINDKHLQPNLLFACRTAANVGSCLLRHPATHRFDWTTTRLHYVTLGRFAANLRVENIPSSPFINRRLLTGIELAGA
ncbi:MAG: hypothetical protein Q9187_004285 [Circinaria calcarea]